MAASMRFRSYLLHQARQNLSSHDYGAAFSHYLLAVKLDHGSSEEIHEEFVACMNQWTELLDSCEEYDELSKAFSQAKAVCCFSDTLMSALGEQALRLENLSTAVNLTQDAMQSFPESVTVKEAWEHVSYAVVERWHFKMLNDIQRNRSYHDAIVSTIQNKSVSTVLDIGCGTGLLSVFAEKGGAKSVTLCDAASVMTEICSAVLASHRQQTQSSAQFRVFDARSTSLSVPEHIPERVDLVVTEIFDAALFGEHCLSTLCHAWSCLLHNSPHRKSQVIPKGAELYVCAIECPEIRKENCVQQSSVPLLDLSGTHITSRTCAAGGDDPYTTEDLYSIRNSYRFLSPIHSLMTVDFNDPQNLEVLCSFSQDFILDVYAEGTVDALAVWFDLDLCEGVKVSTGPSEQCCWEQAIFPVVAVGSREENKAADAGHPGSVKVNCGDQLKIHCTLNDGCLRLTVKDVVAFGYFLNSCHISPHLSDATEQVNGQLPQLSSSVTEKVGSHGFCQSSSTAKMGGDGSAFQLSNRTKKDVKGVFDSSSIAEEFTGSKVGLSDCVAQEVGVPSVCTVEEGDGSASQTVCSAEDFTKAFRGCDVDHVSEPKQTSCIVSRTVENSQGGSSTEQSKKAGLLTPVGQHADGAEMDCSDMEPCNDKHVSPNSDFASQELRCLNKPPLTANCADSKHRNHGSSHAENGEQGSTSSAGLLPPIGQLNGACVCSYSQVNGDVLSDNSRGAKRDASVCVNGARTGSCCESSKVSVPCESECSTQHVKSAKEKIVRGDSGLCMEMENDCKNQSPTTQSSCLGDADTWCVQNHNNNSSHGDNFEIKHHRHHDLYLQNNTQDTRPCTFHLQREEVRRLNDMKFNSLYVSALQHTQTHAGKPLTLLTISNSPPLHGLLALKSGFFKEAEFCYMGVSKTEEVKGLMEHVGSRNGVSRSGWKWNRGSVEDIVEGGRGGGGGGVPVVSLDMVETAGCLRAGVVNELRALRSAVSGNTVMIPQTVDVYAVLISSQQLQDMSCVTSDHNTLGVSIAPHINPFQTRTFLDLDIHALPHKNLSDVVHVFHMDIQSCVTPSAGPTEVPPPDVRIHPQQRPKHFVFFSRWIGISIQQCGFCVFTVQGASSDCP